MAELTYRNLDSTETFRTLAERYEAVDLKQLLTPDRVDAYDIPIGAGLRYNFASKCVDDAVIDLLVELAREQQLLEKYRALTNGEVMNTGERRKVLHHLQRGRLGDRIVEDGVDIEAFYTEQMRRCIDFAGQVRSGRIRGAGEKPFTTVVQIGIGGSDLGPRALYHVFERIVHDDTVVGSRSVSTGDGEDRAHREDRKNRGNREDRLGARFLSNVDPDDAYAALEGIDLEATLFILVTKSGTTQETLTNHALVVETMKKIEGIDPSKQIVVVTSRTSPLAESPEFLDAFYIDDYVGGRYSATSPVGGLILSLAFGGETFEDLLSGAHEADKHALNEEIASNAAIVDALIGVYERNVSGYPSTAVLPYSQGLLRFPAHLQQLDMESNGKGVNRYGEPLSYPTGPVVFGEPGTNGQHSFFQLLHQGTDIVPLQFIGFRNGQSGFDAEIDGSTSRTKLNANLAAQILAFAKGSSSQDRNKHFEGNRPSSLIYGDRLDARAAGALLAHFENKVMFQGFLWNINSFDQEGVQLGKILTKQILGGGDLDPALSRYARLLGVDDISIPS